MTRGKSKLIDGFFLNSSSPFLLTHTHTHTPRRSTNKVLRMNGRNFFIFFVETQDNARGEESDIRTDLLSESALFSSPSPLPSSSGMYGDIRDDCAFGFVWHYCLKLRGKADGGVGKKPSRVASREKWANLKTVTPMPHISIAVITPTHLTHCSAMEETAWLWGRDGKS